MNAVTISTKLYYQEMMDFFIGDCVKVCQRGNIYFFTVHFQQFHLGILAELLEDIVLDNNPIVRASHHIYQRMKELIFICQRPALQKDLHGIISLGQPLYLEGYILFRMQKYERQVNDILYAAVKRSLCGI